MKHKNLTNEQSARLKPLLPPQKPHTGRTNLPHRRVINGILWVLRTGAAWEELPRRYGKHKTVSSRYYRWLKAGIWDPIFADLQAQADADGSLDWTLHFVDSTLVRAHQQAAGAKNSDAATEAIGRSQAGVSTKLNVRADGSGKPMAFVLQAGQQHESRAFEPLMEQAAITRPCRGGPGLRPRRVAADKAYSNRRIRHWLRRRAIRVTIPRKRDERRRGPFDKALYKLRARVEQLINRLKQFRRIATRYEKRAASYLGMVTIGAILLYL
jgi:transposase